MAQLIQRIDHVSMERPCADCHRLATYTVSNVDACGYHAGYYGAILALAA